MKISFVIPAYNEEKLLPQCLLSVQREIALHPDLETEMIVVNNASTDKTGEKALKIGNVKVVDENRKGISWSRQAGFKASSGDLIANIDADTMLPDGWLKTVKEEFLKNKELVALSGPHVYYDCSPIVRVMTKLWYMVGLLFDRVSHFLFKNGSMLQGGNYVVRRVAMEQIGGYDTSIEFWGEDTDTGKKLNKVGKVKWTFALPIYASSRRIKAMGLVRIGALYASTFISIVLTGKPAVKKYKDFRN